MKIVLCIILLNVNVLFAQSIPELIDLNSDQLGQIPIPEFHQVSPDIYRGGRPEEVGLVALKEMGIKAILNLDDDKAYNSNEEALTKKLGLIYFPVPMSGFWTPKDEQVNKALSILTDPSNYPIFVHCKHGQDRSGLIVGLYRVRYERWTPQDAYDEMLRYNFHKALVFLDSYFKKTSGY